MADVSVIVLAALLGGQAESWAALLELAPTLGNNWLLVGGQMVFLHEVERQASEVRPTDDIDVVVDIRAEPAGLANVHGSLMSAGFEQQVPSPSGTAHRYSRGGAVFDVLAPDNVGWKATLRLGAGRTIQAPGATQAFGRSELVWVQFAGVSAVVRRPNIIGALLGKASAVVKITSQTAAGRAKHLRDFDSLASARSWGCWLMTLECPLSERHQSSFCLPGLSCEHQRWPTGAGRWVHCGDGAVGLADSSVVEAWDRAEVSGV